MEMGMDPVHPGECIRESVEAMGWTVGGSGEAARGLASGILSRPERPRGGVGRDGARA